MIAIKIRIDGVSKVIDELCALDPDRSHLPYRAPLFFVSGVAGQC
jgi:hypothetical protein